ncbi:tetratricopeptide repeat protein [Paraburkholderia sp. J76]|uniref:O-linked N-acetylglucosamine transferase, SPINDLY family protein n=1 Tax=Paraburkholderia sp. J76 TaxID=2805439 RepID=UPI002ABDD44C|nr:tetratricopeptide repeat protein [Paraburkholderia sp. J76]
MGPPEQQIDETRGVINREAYSNNFEKDVTLLPAPIAEAVQLNLAGANCYGAGKKTEAVAYWERAISSDPGYAQAYSNLGTVLCELGRVPEGESALRFSLKIRPDLPEANNSLANVLRKRGELREAEQRYRRALSERPQWAVASQNLGGLLHELRRFPEAEAAYRVALNSQPESWDAHYGLGLLLQDQGRRSEAEAVFIQVVALNPGRAEAYAALGRLLFTCSRFDEAEIVARKATSLNPESSDAFLVLGSILEAQSAGNYIEALDAYKRAVELDPDNLVAHSNLAYGLNFVCEDGHEILAECKRFSSHFEKPYLANTRSYENDRSTIRRLRIGYVSADFKHHCQSFFTIPLFKNHDTDSFELYCYSSVRSPDDFTFHLSKLANVWRNVAGLSDDALAEQIRRDEIDVLVDLTMHMSDGRPLLFARKPAPVQVAWLAYPGTTGSSAIDYRLTDPWLDPFDKSDADERYSERSYRLPHTFWCYEPLVSALEVGTLPADTYGSVTFGCLNSARKLTDRTLGLWANVLRRVPDSKMIVLLEQGRPREQASEKFRRFGVDPSRLIFVGKQSRRAYLETYRRIDIALDTFPYNGHTTSLDSFWMGVPVVTIIGRTPVSRGGYSLLASLGLLELSSSDDSGFVEIAVLLANDLPRLRNLRLGLRQRMERSPLMDGAGFARGIEQAYRQMWEAWCAAN